MERSPNAGECEPMSLGQVEVSDISPGRIALTDFEKTHNFRNSNPLSLTQFDVLKNT